MLCYQEYSLANSRIAELTATLEEKDERMTQLKGQLETLQGRIAELEDDNAKVYSESLPARNKN